MKEKKKMGEVFFFFFLRNKLGTEKNLTDIRVAKIGRGCSPGTSSSLHDG